MATGGGYPGGEPRDRRANEKAQLRAQAREVALARIEQQYEKNLEALSELQVNFGGRLKPLIDWDGPSQAWMPVDGQSGYLPVNPEPADIVRVLRHGSLHRLDTIAQWGEDICVVPDITCVPFNALQETFAENWGGHLHVPDGLPDQVAEHGFALVSENGEPYRDPLQIAKKTFARFPNGAAASAFVIHTGSPEFLVNSCGGAIPGLPQLQQAVFRGQGPQLWDPGMSVISPGVRLAMAHLLREREPQLDRRYSKAGELLDAHVGRAGYSARGIQSLRLAMRRVPSGGSDKVVPQLVFDSVGGPSMNNQAVVREAYRIR